MKHRLVISTLALAATCALGGPAAAQDRSAESSAQNPRRAPTPFFSPNNSSQFRPTIGDLFGPADDQRFDPRFDPSVGFDPSLNGLGLNSNRLGFNGINFSNGFVTGLGFGPFFGGVVTTQAIGFMPPVGTGIGFTTNASLGLPIVGINTRMRIPSTPRRATSGRRSGSTRRQAQATNRRQGDADPDAGDLRRATDSEADDAPTARRLEAYMRRTTMISGRVVRVGATGILVRVRENGRQVAKRYASNEVFFYEGERLLDGGQAAGRLRAGDDVLVPESAGRRDDTI